jgi:hypothetical protein
MRGCGLTFLRVESLTIVGFIHAMKTKACRCAAILFLVIAPTTAWGCGDEGAADGLTQSIVEKSDLDNAGVFVKPRDIAATPIGSPQRALLDLWSSLQYSAWPSVLAFYNPEFVRLVGTPTFIDALRAQTSYFRSTKPVVNGVTRDGNLVVVRFLARDFSGEVTATSKTWERARAGWRIRYDPQLDAILQAYVQNRVQARIDPAAEKPSREAVEAGRKAALIQANFLERTPTAAPRGRPGR